MCDLIGFLVFSVQLLAALLGLTWLIYAFCCLIQVLFCEGKFALKNHGPYVVVAARSQALYKIYQRTWGFPAYLPRPHNSGYSSKEDAARIARELIADLPRSFTPGPIVQEEPPGKEDVDGTMSSSGTSPGRTPTKTP